MVMPNNGNGNNRLTITTESYSLERFKRAVEKYRNIQSNAKPQQQSVDNSKNILSNTKTQSVVKSVSK